MPAGTTSSTLQVLREYDKVARECARDGRRSSLLSAAPDQTRTDRLTFEILMDLDYVKSVMAIQTIEIIPAKFPELNKLAWNRDPCRPMADDEIFALYERNWRFVDREHLTGEETRLLMELSNKYGHGFRLV